MARLLYISTWCEADKEGRMIWKPKTLKMRYFPADTFDIDLLCSELISSKLVVLYGDGLAVIPSFTTHQHINPRETASNLPVPDGKYTRRHASPRVKSRNDAQGGREGKGREGKARDASSGFADFWAAYPNKKAKQDAEKAWLKVKPDDELSAKIIGALGLQIYSEAWVKDGGAFIPHASTWLNGRRWEDEIQTGKNGVDIFAGAH